MSKISATISAATKEELDRFTDKYSVKIRRPPAPTKELRKLMRGGGDRD